jgi:hypothetical protein
MFILVLNSSNIVQDGQNNKLVYNFPNSIQFKDKYIAVSSITMYYSWFNIDSKYQNNVITYSWTSAGVTTNYTITIPNGLYNISDINYYIQWTVVNNGHYLVNSIGENRYYIELIVNPNRYAIQLNTFLVPTALPVGFTNPAGLVFPTQSFNPVVTFPPNFSGIVGYPSNFTSEGNVNNAYVAPTASSSNNYVTKNALGTISYLSNSAPNVQPNSSVYLSISNINNPYSQPSSIIYSVTPTVNIGEQVIERPPNFMWNRMIDGTYNELRLTILGIDKSPITLNDPNMTILLTIKDKDEISIK